MGSGLTSIALTGLRAAQAGLATTGHNISNVNTAGYSRQQTIQTAALAQFSGNGYVGTGVNVTSIRRVYSDYATQSLRESVSTSAKSNAFSTEINRIDGWLADSSSNLSTAVDSFFKTAQTVANNPADVSARQTMLSSARTLAGRFNDLNARLTQQGADIDRQIDDNVTSVNALAQQVAALNQRIQVDDRSTTLGQLPNDLLDQRDALVQQISTAIGATAIPQSDGSLNVFVGNGQPLVVGQQANRLVAIPGGEDTTKKELAVMVNNSPARIPNGLIQSGTLGGLMNFRDDVLTNATNTLGQIAAGLGAALNAQNKLGQDANGLAGADLFKLGSPVVVAATDNSATAKLAVTITDASKLSTADYRLSYDGSQYTLTNLSSKSSQTFASLPQTVDGVKIDVASPLSAGDQFTIAPTRNGAKDFAVATTDPAKIASAAPISLATGANTGTARQAALSVVPADPLPANLKAPVDVKFHVANGVTTYDLVDKTSGSTISSGNAYTDGVPIVQNGWSLTFSGVPADNDTFTVGPNINGSGDNRNALLLAAVQKNAVTSIGSAQDTYAGLVGNIGNRANEATALATADASLVTQAQESRDSISGVNLDEEAANLQKYQQAYQAASKSIQTANAMFDAVMALFR